MTDLTNITRTEDGSLPINNSIVKTAFIGTICLSALLLFLIQPMFSKMALPLLGGAPNVWTTAMLFFQTILLAGYAYAHWLGTKTSVPMQILIHLSVTLLAALSLPISIAAGWSPPTTGDATIWLLGLFAVSLGAPFFALSANAPLLQKWYAHTGGDGASDPYFLYAASNIGSFGALIAYPFLLEPMLGARAQSVSWTYGYFALAIGLVVCGWMATRRAGTATSEEDNTQEASAPVARPALREVGIWIGLAFIPSSLMLSITAKIATDIGSFPLIWTMTLALYLLSYVFAFSEKLRPPAHIMRFVHAPLVVICLGLSIGLPNLLGTAVLGLLCVLLFTVALTCHSALAERRPAEAHLTRFYLAMSVGGALGGLFNSVISPLVFNDVYEYPIVLALALLAAPGAKFAVREDIKEAMPRAVLLGVSVLAVGTLIWFEVLPVYTFIIPVDLFVVFALLWFKYPLRQAVLALSVVTTATLSNGLIMDSYKERSFFGVYEVSVFEEDNVRALSHGTTVHGSQNLDPETAHDPTGYYHELTPLGQLAQTHAKEGPVAVVGLGAGGLACHHAREVDWTFYEIDPLVDRIARNPDMFTFLSHCAPDAETVLGDARLRLAEEDSGKYNLIILDAFSSDAIPVHLLTVEAMQMYREKLSENGFIAVHISNRYFDLAKPIAKVAETVGMISKVQFFSPSDEEYANLAYPSNVIILADNEKAFGATGKDERWQPAIPSDKAVWTDDYANILSALLKKGIPWL